FVFDLASGASKVQIEGFETRASDDQTLEVDVPKTSGLNPVFEELSKQEIQVMSMRNKSNRLEELFVRLVEANQAKGEADE
ncbi:MAG: ABC transporter ATP-binding protein, partial [Glaciecola sp.]